MVPKIYRDLSALVYPTWGQSVGFEHSLSLFYGPVSNMITKQQQANWSIMADMPSILGDLSEKSFMIA